MTTSVADLKKLPIQERLQLVEDLWDSIAADSPDAVGVGEDQKAEMRRRVVAHDSDPKSAVPWEQVREELRRRAPE